MPEFKSTHDLQFLSAVWHTDPEWNIFRIGTCGGLWKDSWVYYDILSIVNDEPGNGHFQDVFEWFENSCRRDGKALRILEVWNKKLKKHLIEKRGFFIQSGNNLVKPLPM